MTRFWLIRHGEPAEEARGRCYGSLDIGLSAAGRAQMAQVAEYLKGESIDCVYSSPLSRALESARILAAVAACPVQVAADLRELDFGELEGLRYEEIEVQYPDLYRQWMAAPTGIRFPKGESFLEMRTRVLAAWETIRREREGRATAIVSHGGVNRILLAWALQTPDDCLFRLAQDYSAINRLEIVEGVPSVKSMNYTIHYTTGPRSIPAP